MRIPFSREEFFGVFAAYNEAVWPAQLLFLALAAFALLLVARGSRLSRWVAFWLALMWTWMALAYHLAFFAAINPAAQLFAVAFIAQAILLAIAGAKGGLRFGGPMSRTRRAVGWSLALYAIAGYPAIGYAFGQQYPALPTFGLPCPTTIFTLALFAWASRPVSWTLLVIPVLWSVVATSAAISLRVPEDYALPIAALALVALRLSHRRMLS